MGEIFENIRHLRQITLSYAKGMNCLYKKNKKNNIKIQLEIKSFKPCQTFLPKKLLR